MGSVLSYDTETALIVDNSRVPEYVLSAVASDSGVWIVHKPDLRSFWEQHAGCTVIMHTAAFDIAVTEACCGFDFGAMVETGLIVDISILFRLLEMAVSGDVPPRYSLAVMSEKLLGEKLDKDDGIRLTFGDYLRDGKVDYSAIPEHHIGYAAGDAIATYALGRRLEADAEAVADMHGLSLEYGLLGHDIQLKGAIALAAIERRGIAVDGDAVRRLDGELATESESSLRTLARYGYVPGQKGVTQVFNKIVSDMERRLGVRVPTTPKTGAKSQRAEDLATLVQDEFVAAFLRHKEVGKLRKTYLSKLAGTTVHPRYTLLVKTGRTSCGSPSIQNLPRRGGIRECLVPRPGHVFVACDYRMLELCTLAQVAFRRFGNSRMRELLNEGVDLHSHVAAKILGRDPDTVGADERQRAKAVNFGLPGGMGADGLSGYARASYGVDLSVADAETWRERWLELFPEMRQWLDGGDGLARLADALDLDSYPGTGPEVNAKAVAAIVVRVAGGYGNYREGRAFTDDEIDWAWDAISNSRAGTIRKLAGDIDSRRGSWELRSAVFPPYVATIPTGRMRANCGYTASRNWPFQALAADGAKLALYDLERGGYRVVAFIHDEVVVEVPEGGDVEKAAFEISDVMKRAMKRVCPDVGIETEFKTMRKWEK